jgi:hypothetical protein
MNNEFYHGFRPGFNFWYVLVVIFLLMTVAFGLNCARLSENKRRVLTRDNEDKVLSAISVVLVLILHIFMAIESGAGLVQVMLNSFGNDTDPGWIVFLLPVALMFSVGVFYSLLFGAGKLAKYLKVKSLEQKKH